MTSVSKKPTFSARPESPVSARAAAPTATGVKCGERSVFKFQKFINIINSNPAGINIYLARALLNDDLLDSFDGQPNASECVFSYPNSDWYSVYIIDEDGNKQWNPEEGYPQLYFKVEIINDGTDAKIIDETFERPDELYDAYGREIENCRVTQSRGCGNPEGYTARAATAPRAGRVVASPSASPSSSRVKAGRVVASPAATPRAGRVVPARAAEVPRVSPALRAELEELSVGAGAERSAPSGPKGKISREYFEQLKSKELIVNWMIENMTREDLVKCIQKGAVSAADLASAERLASLEVPEDEDEAGPSGYVPVRIDDKLTKTVVQAAASMPVSKYAKELKAATKEAIKESLPKESAAKNQAILALCIRAGVENYSVKEVTRRGKTSYVLYDGDDPVVDEDQIEEVIDECATLESKKLKNLITKLRWRDVGDSLRVTARENIYSRKPKKPTVQSIVDEILSIGDKNEKIKSIVALCTRSGKTNYQVREVTRRGKTSFVLYDGEDPVTDEDEINEILKECATAVLARKSEFGKKRKSSSTQQKKFSAAAKKCKGKSNFRKCMSKALKKK